MHGNKQAAHKVVQHSFNAVTAYCAIGNPHVLLIILNS